MRKGASHSLVPVDGVRAPGCVKPRLCPGQSPLVIQFSVFSSSDDHQIHFASIFPAFSLLSPVTHVPFVGTDFEDLFDDDDVQ